MMAVVAPRATVPHARRRLVILSAAGLATTLLSRASFGAEDQAARAARFIRDSGNELQRIARDNPTPEAQRAALAPFLQRVVAIPDLGRFCLGRYWLVASPAQRQRYLAMFADALVSSVASRLKTYQGGDSQIVIAPARPSEGAWEIPTTVRTGNAPPVHIDWLVSTAAGAPKIIDVRAEGISLRITLRSDYSGYLQSHGGDVDALLGAMHKIMARS